MRYIYNLNSPASMDEVAFTTYGAITSVKELLPLVNRMDAIDQAINESIKAVAYKLTDMSFTTTTTTKYIF